MIDRRLYRFAFLAVIPALIALLFAVEPVAEPLPPGIATTGFDGRAAASIAREIEALGPERTPGSTADRAAAKLVADRFATIPVGEVVRKPVGYGGLPPAPSSETVVVTLPGETDSTILVIARRAAAAPAERLASSTATGVLTRLAASLGESRHEHELVFASVPDADAAAAIARELNSQRRVIGSIAIDDARGIRTGDVVLFRAPGDLAASSTLAETASAVSGGEGVPEASPEPPLGQIARLGVGIAFGTQSRLLGEDIDAIAISGTGELPPHESDGAPVRVLSPPLETTGEIAMRVIQALDAAPELPDEEGSFVRFGDTVVPGWPFGLLALALLIPALLASVDALARAARRGERATNAIESVLVRSLPFVAALALLYLLAVVGAVEDPSFPFDPGAHELGAGEIVALAALGIVALVTAVLLRVISIPSSYSAPTLAAAAGLVASLAVLGVWIANPFTALILAPLAHVWVIAAGEQRPSRPLAGAVLLACLVPLAASLIYVADKLKLAGDAPWTVAMLLTGGELRVAQALLACGLAGTLISVVAASTRGRAH